MVESEAKELSEEIMLGAVTSGIKLPAGDRGDHRAGRNLRQGAWAVPGAGRQGASRGRTEGIDRPQIEAPTGRGKQDRSNQLDAAKVQAAARFASDNAQQALALKLFKDIEKDLVRGAIIRGEPRIDGRDSKTVRPIESQVGLLPRAHGSALFTRGETQAIVVATLGTGQDEQIIDALAGEYRESFMLHYNFPPYATGEAGRMGSPGRREIGHGKLAWRAVRLLLPSKENFPTICIVSEIRESNGSRRWPGVRRSPALMDAERWCSPVAGIAMG